MPKPTFFIRLTHTGLHPDGRNNSGPVLGTPVFQPYSSTSATYVDVAATSATISDNNQILFSTHLGETGNQTFAFNEELDLQPDETLTIAAKASQGNPAYVLVSLNSREDQ